MTVALVPAAGLSMRMGQQKLTLPIFGRPLLDWVLGALRAGGIDTVLVVTGPHGLDVAALAHRGGADALVLPESTSGMRETVERGLDWLEERFRPSSEDRWLLVPGDLPLMRGAVVRQVVEVAETDCAASIFIPTFHGRRGHPALFRWQHVAGIRAFQGGLGLNAYLREHLAATREVPVTTAEILFDVDTPEDYQRALEAIPPRISS